MHVLSGRLLVGALVIALALVAGCKGKAGVVPVKSPISTFVPPEADEVFPEEETDDEAEADDAGFEE